MTTKTSNKYLFTLICIILIVGVFYLLRPHSMMQNGDIQNATTSVETPNMTPGGTPTPEAVTTTNGVITFSTPSDFGLATTKDQILVKGYIPACDDGFDYCLYYNGSNYAGTNFDTAGVRIKNRTDLKTAASCLNVAPLGYDIFKPTIVSTSTSYTLAVYGPVGDAGAGHYASGEIYRLAYDGTCQEFETRIGASQFANYPAGAIKEFTVAQQDELKAKMIDILKNTTLFSGEKIKFTK